MDGEPEFVLALREALAMAGGEDEGVVHRNL